MAEIFGTPRADVLVGTDANDLIRGGRGEDSIYGGLGDDILYGGLGNDYIVDRDGRSEIWGGRGGDQIFFSDGYAWGGLGNDTIQVQGPGMAIGGVGSDTIIGSGTMWGDQTPDQPPQRGGNDRLSLTADADGSWANGGEGRDTFQVLADMFNPTPTSAVIDDFQAGQDKILAYGDVGRDLPENVWGRLDATGDGILDWRDSIGPDGDWTTPDGGAVYTDGVNLFLGLNATTADPNATDATCWLTLHNVTQVSEADWLFPDWAA